MALEGPILRRWANNRIGRQLIKRVTHGGLGKVGVKLGRMSRLLDGRKPVELSMSILRYFFAPYLEEVRVDDDEAVFFLKRCPYGWHGDGDAPLCDAVMQLD